MQASITAGSGCKGAMFWEWTVRNPGEYIDVSLPNGNHPYGVSLWDETFQCALYSIRLDILFHMLSPSDCWTPACRNVLEVPFEQLVHAR